MEQSIVELVGRQRQRVDAVGYLAGRFMDEPVQAGLARLSGRLARLAATLAAPAAREAAGLARLEGHLERLVREVGQLRFDDPTAIARVAWVLAEIEEAFRTPTPGAAALFMPVYTAN
jgi:hypothetical protein